MLCARDRFFGQLIRFSSQLSCVCARLPRVCTQRHCDCPRTNAFYLRALVVRPRTLALVADFTPDKDASPRFLEHVDAVVAIARGEIARRCAGAADDIDRERIRAGHECAGGDIVGKCGIVFPIRARR